MTDLPSFPIEPIQPPPGAYDGVAQRARNRRTRTALLAVGLSLAVAVGGVGLSTALGGSDARRDSLQIASGEPTPPAPSPEQTSAQPDPSATPPSPVTSPTAAATTPGPGAPTESPVPSDLATDLHSGLVVDSAGRPVPGVNVYLLSVNAFPPRPPDAVTDAKGRFSVSCTSGRRALLSTWPLGARQSAATPNLAPVFAGGASSWSEAEPLRCGAATTVMPVGATITGTIRRATADGGTEPLADHETLADGIYSDELDVQGSIIATWDPVDGRYRWTGLPAGSVLVSDGPNHGQRIVLRAGQVLTNDWIVPCRCPSASPSQSPSASPSPAAA